MKQFSLQYIDLLLEPLVGLADDDNEVAKYSNINSHSSEEFKQIINQILKPHYELLDQPSKEMAQGSLRYFLGRPDTDFERIYYSNLMPLDAPHPARMFFVWLWEVLFDQQNWEDNGLPEFDEEQNGYAFSQAKLISHA